MCVCFVGLFFLSRGGGLWCVCICVCNVCTCVCRCGCVYFKGGREHGSGGQETQILV